MLFCICLADKNMVTFTREDRRGRVPEFHSQGMGKRDIKATAYVIYRHSKNSEGLR